MTFLEKYKEDTQFKDISEIGCPSQYEYEEPRGLECYGNCDECWNREMPNTEQLTDDEQIIDFISKNAYDQGLNDAWELYRKAGEMSDEDYDRCFGLESHEGLTDLSPQEAFAKLKAYEESQHLKLGEIVIVNIPDEKGIVIVKCQDGEYKVLMEDFDIVKLPASKLTKTGRFVALNNIIEQIGE